MTEFRIEVVRLGPVEKHPNADSLSITQIHGGYPCIFKTGDFIEGDLAVYVPIDAVVPENSERFAFLNGRRRIKAVRLRGIFSMGLLTPIEPGWIEGQDVREALGIEKYEPTMELDTGGDNEVDLVGWPTYTDIEDYRRHKGVLQLDEDVVLTEKIHGANARYLHDGLRLWCGSRTNTKRDKPKSIWWAAARQLNLVERLAAVPNIVVFGEVFGQVQDLKYGEKGVAFCAFDAMDLKSRTYLDYGDFIGLMAELDLPTVPELYRGPWTLELLALAEGKTTLSAEHIREGFVVRPTKERYAHMGRVILKVIGEGYLLRKEK